MNEEDYSQKIMLVSVT